MSFRLNFRGWAVDNAGVDQVSRPMQIALVAVVLLAGMWFTVLKPKPASSPGPVAVAAPVAPGVAGLTSAVDKAKAASATSDATNAKIQQASGGAAAATPAKKAAVTKAAAVKAAAVKAAATRKAAVTKTAKPAAVTKAVTPAPVNKPAAVKVPVDPSTTLINFLSKGKTVVLLFHGAGADDAAARKAVHQTALKDKRVVSAYADISKVADYAAITTDINITTAPTILVIGTDGKTTLLTGYVDAGVVRQAVGDARRNAAAAAK
ncbi:MAG: hypothetical protein QOE86_2641, partial [Solirubrobacteraceae bacterium]|nr:hypothetical protein [Solirubrobacteraceae bacterium]